MRKSLENNMEKLEALKLFCKYDGYRAFTENPVYQIIDDVKCVVATDGHILIICHNLQGIDENDITLNLTSPQFNSVVPKQNCTELLSVETLKNAIDRIPIVDYEEIECDECAGTGIVSFEYRAGNGVLYSKDCDCPICSGDGFSRRYGVKSHDKSYAIEFCDVLFKQKYIKILYEALSALGIDKIPYLIQKDEKKLTLKNEDYTIILMGMQKNLLGDPYKTIKI